MHSIAHVLLFGSMVAAAIGALTFCLVLAAFGFTPAEGQPDEVARRERFARIGRLVAGTGFGLAALFGVVGVAASPSGAPSLQPQLEALRGRLGDMTTRLGHIADLADHLRVHVGDWMPAPRRAETPTAAIDRGERSHTHRAAITQPDRAPVSNTPAASALPERDVRTTVPTALPHTVTSREIRATTPEPSPRKQQSPASNGDVASAPAPAPDRPVTRPASPPTPSRQAVAERTPQFDVPAVSAISPPSSPAVPESPVVDTSGPPFGLVAPPGGRPASVSVVPRGDGVLGDGDNKLGGSSLDPDKRQGPRRESTSGPAVVEADHSGKGGGGDRRDEGRGPRMVDRGSRSGAPTITTRGVTRLDRAEPVDRQDRADRSDRIDRAEKVDRVDRSERVERPDRIERPDRVDRIERPERIERPDRPQKAERVERVERVDRRERIDRPERSGRH